MDTTDEIKVPADEKAKITTYRSEARLLKALAYLYSIDMFGGFKMLAENDRAAGFKAPYANRSTLFKYVESELLAIDASLPANETNKFANVDKSTAWMLLSMFKGKHLDCAHGLIYSVFNIVSVLIC